MRKAIIAILFAGIVQVTYSQTNDQLSPVSSVEYTSVKNQANSGTCWSFSTTSLVESQSIKNGLGKFDISEMYTVRNIYLEKARNYILRQGAAQFGPGGLGHDVIHAIENYGAVPESVYSGLLLGAKAHDHSKLDTKLKLYLDSLLKTRPIPSDWIDGYITIMDEHLGRVPDTFLFEEKQYTPVSFAKEVLKFNRNDYVYITSFSHHPFYKPFVLEIPDNWANESYYNIPLGEMIDLAKDAVSKGYSLMWDADVSNKGFDQRAGFAMQWKEEERPVPVNPDAPEVKYDQGLRQRFFETLVTQDDHLMHLVGLEKSKEGKIFFLVKNSWGEVGPFKGLIKVSESYFAMNTITLVVPKAAVNTSLKNKLGLQ